MKVTIFCLILFSFPLLSQTYLNVHFSDGTNQNTLVSTLTKITFDQNNDQTIFYCTDLGVVTKNLSTIHELTFDNSGSGGTLPIELINFTSQVYQGKVTLLWSTATEVDNFGFDIERYQSASGWNKIGFVKGSGNSNSYKFYSFTDQPYGGTKYLYRLKQTDKNGKYSYSSVIEAVIGIPIMYELKQNFPNPFNPSSIITYSIPQDGLVSLIVYDITGKEVASLVNDYKKAGSYEVSFNGSRMASGVYFCKMTAKNFGSSIKMLLLK